MTRWGSRISVNVAVLFFAALAACDASGGFVSNEATAAECADKIDNDGDQLVDCADPDCKLFCGGGSDGGRGDTGSPSDARPPDWGLPQSDGGPPP